MNIIFGVKTFGHLDRLFYLMHVYSNVYNVYFFQFMIALSVLYIILVKFVNIFVYNIYIYIYERIR